MGHSDISVTNECVYAFKISRRKGRIGKAEGKGTGKKGNGADRYGVCQARIKASEWSLKAVGGKRGRGTSGKFYFHLYLFYLPR